VYSRRIRATYTLVDGQSRGEGFVYFINKQKSKILQKKIMADIKPNILKPWAEKLAALLLASKGTWFCGQTVGMMIIIN
jgi:hypothetical protein